MKYGDIISALKSGNVPIKFVQESFISYDNERVEKSLRYLDNNDGKMTVKLIDGSLSLKINVMN